jgi:replicative DNA helicase
MPDDPQVDSLKLPPHSLEAEQSVLGGLLLDNDAVDKVGDVLADGDFYSEAHRLIYAHILKLAAEAKPADVVTVSEGARFVQKLDYIGGLAYSGALVQNVPTAANIRHYAHIVRDRSILRQLAGTAGDIADSAYNPLGRSAKEVSTRPRRRCCTSRAGRARRSGSTRRSGRYCPAVVERSRRCTTATILRM